MSTQAMLALCLVASLVASSSQAVAQPKNKSAQASPSEAQSKAHYKKAKALVSAKNYQAAYAEFKAGHTLSPRPLFLFNMGECAYYSQNEEQAGRDYREYLRLDPKGQMAGLAKKRLAAIGPARVATQLDTKAEVSAPKSAAAPPSESVSLQVRGPETTRMPNATSRPELTQTNSAPPIWSPKRWPFWAVVGTTAVASVAIVYGTRRGDDNAGAIDWRN